ncbi:FAD-dependent oxidoreductase [Aquamicrobium sp. LC103]|uniref:oxidoreductase n=1 Tax=Aquamicrobium sp. LC103 TaxID=1120658 RepID=UPI00063E7B16|nr:FAD-dependent oxidoreductase [Aquamicrobium sp. LC103]TKT74582.1 FAD-dependent oxidoreductase [Aquamicrobium sp. LC103]
MTVVTPDTASLSARLKKDPLLQPLRIRHLTLKNRIMSTSHAATLDDGAMPKELYQRYHEEKARGGLALTMFGGSSMIAPDSNWGGSQMDVSADAVIPHFQSFAERIHAHGAALMIQISHLGRRADSSVVNWLPNIAPSRLREVGHRSFSREMDAHDIKRVVKQYGEAARRCKEGGLDGLETMTGGHLIGQFLSPLTNFRTDGFGGSIENRARFGLMVHEEIRKQVGDDFIVGIRYDIDEADENGLTFEDALKAAELFEREGHVDFFNCIFGRLDTELALLTFNIPSMAQPLAPFLKPVGLFKQHTRLPVFHAAKIADLSTARFAVAEGLVDMVGMTRAHIADPQIVNKLMRGEEDRIRPCVGASHCLYRKVACVHNAATGRETQLPQVIEQSQTPGRKVVVVGGGPAGLEAARVSAEAGHRVVLFEAASKVGGQMIAAAQAGWRRDMYGVVDWRESELQHLGVDIRTDFYAEPDDVLAENPDIVVVATGGIPDMDWIDGAEHCTSVWDVLLEPTQARDDIVIYDGTGRHPAPSTAVHLVGSGHAVRLVTLDPVLAPEMEYQSRTTYRKQLAELEVPVIQEYKLEKVRKADNALDATFRHQLTGKEMVLRTAQVVVEHGTVPMTDVFDGLRDMSVNKGVTDQDALLAIRKQPRPAGAEGFELYRIGDAVTSRSLHAAIYDALRLCITF